MIPARLIRFALLILLPLAGTQAPADTGGRTAANITVMGDSLACAKTPAGEISVCSDKISAVSLLNLQAYASCLVMHHKLDADIATRAYATRRNRDPLRALVADDKSCMPSGGARMSAILLASALAEHLPGWRGRLREGFAKTDSPADPIQCVIAASPRVALSVLRSAPLSDDELEAVHLLVRYFPNCLPPGVQLETNRAALRAILALTLLDADAADGVGRDLAPDQAQPVLSYVSTPLLLNRPRIALAPLARVGGVRDRVALNATLPYWTQQQPPENGLHHGGYGHPDLPQQLLPEDELAQVATMPDEDSGNPAGPPQSSRPGSAAAAPQ